MGMKVTASKSFRSATGSRVKGPCPRETSAVGINSRGHHRTANAFECAAVSKSHTSIAQFPLTNANQQFDLAQRIIKQLSVHLLRGRRVRGQVSPRRNLWSGL